MKELLASLLGKKATIHSVDESLSFGVYTLCDIRDNGLLCLDKDGNTVIVNIDYVTSVAEVKEKAKKKG